MSSLQPHRNDPPLTGVELDALRARSVGLTDRMAADVYAVSVEAIKQRLASARLKLCAKNTPHAVAIALRLHLID